MKCTNKNKTLENIYLIMSNNYFNNTGLKYNEKIDKYYRDLDNKVNKHLFFYLVKKVSKKIFPKLYEKIRLTVKKMRS